jgi:hypothetical protein
MVGPHAVPAARAPAPPAPPPLSDTCASILRLQFELEVEAKVIPRQYQSSIAFVLVPSFEAACEILEFHAQQVGCGGVGTDGSRVHVSCFASRGDERHK